MSIMETTDNKERLIFYKRITPYYTQEKVTEVVNVNTENVIISTEAQEPVTTQIYATETETGYTTVEKIEYNAESGISATTVTRIINIPDDITKDCKLTMQDLDDNFLTLKDFDIKEGYYDVETNEIHLVRNNPDLPHVIINMDGSKQEEEEPADEPSEDEPQPIDTSVKAIINDNGSITLTWLTSEGTEVTSTVQQYTEYTDTFKIASETPNIDKAITKKEVLNVVTDYPSNPKVGDKYILTKKTSLCGCFYPLSTIAHISDNIASEWLIWRIPSLSDYETLISNLPCTEGKEGLALKSSEYWNGLDELHFNAMPTYIEENTDNKSCVFCTSDNKTITLTDEDGYIIGDATDETSYSIRLVADVESSPNINLEDAILNILGYTYHVIKIGKQYWIDANLNYDIEGSISIDLDTDFDATTENKAYVIQYDGTKWEKTVIPLGSSIWQKDGNGYLTEYTLTKDKEDKILLLPRFDAGWY